MLARIGDAGVVAAAVVYLEASDILVCRCDADVAAVARAVAAACIIVGIDHEAYRIGKVVAVGNVVEEVDVLVGGCCSASAVDFGVRVAFVNVEVCFDSRC